MSAEDTQERQESLWWLTVSPTIWLVHFLASYASAAIFCAKATAEHAELTSVRIAIAGYTAVALGGIVAVGLRGWRRHRFGSGPTPHDFDTSASRHRFLGFAVLLLSGLSALGVIYVALPAIFFGSCR